MGRSVSKSTLGTWLTKKVWLSLAAVVVGLLAASIGMSLLGSSVVSAQSNSAPSVSISSPSSPVSLYTGQSPTSRQVPRTRTTTCRSGSGRPSETGLFPLPDFVYTPGEQTFDTTPTGSRHQGLLVHLRYKGGLDGQGHLHRLGGRVQLR